MAALGGKRSGEYGSQGRHGAIHQSGQTWLHDLQYKQAPLCLVLLLLDIWRDLLFQSLGRDLVLALDFLQIAEQFANAGIGDLPDRFLIELARLQFHDLGLLTHFRNLQGTGQPERTALHEALDVLPPDQGNMLSEALAIGSDERSPVPGFLGAHIVEQGRGGGIDFAQSVGKVGVHAAVFLFQ